MQPFGTVLGADLLDPFQEMAWKLEIWDGAAWQDVSELGGSGGQNYLKSLSMSLGGAGMMTVPVAGSWSATLDNENGIFHPLHPTSPYAGLLRVGREVRLSVGAEYGGTEHFWQRMIGFMEAPRFSHSDKTVELTGMDYMKLLTDTTLYDVNPVAESGSGSGSGATDDIINGPLHWGRRATFNAVPSPGADLGPDTYVGGDACAIDAGEVNGIGGWISETDFGAVAPIIQVVTPAQESSHAIRLLRWVGKTEQSILMPNASGAVTAGTSAQVLFWARRLHGDAPARMIAYNYKAGLSPVRKVGEVEIALNAGAWTLYSMVVHIADTGFLQLKLYTGGDYAKAFDIVDIDDITIRKYATDYWNRYVLPADCNGPWLVTLNGEPVGQGTQEEGEGGWHYLEDTKSLWFSDQMEVRAGLGNVKVYYYTTQSLDNVLADLLAYSGLYVDRAAALADMDYVPTGIRLRRVWFDSGSALAAVAKICERSNYRFWFTYAGAPCYRPAPVAESVAFAFSSVRDFKNISEFQDDGMIRNKVSIEGAERAMYQVGRDDKANDRYKGEASDVPAGDLPKSHDIKNHLFQSSSSAQIMCEILVAEFRVAKWYAELVTFANPIPLEIGDLITWPIELEPAEVDPGSLGGSGSGMVTVQVMGIIRDVKINGADLTYKVEVVDDLWSAGDLWTGSVSGSPEIDSGSGSLAPVDLCGDDIDGNDSGLAGSPGLYMFVVPSGVDVVTFEAWGPGGKSSPEGGGGGGGAYAKVSLAVAPGDTFYLKPCSSVDAPGPSEVYDDAMSVILSADYGDDAVGTAGGLGGRVADCTHGVWDGGDGAGASFWGGGGGGASAGSTADGGSAFHRTGGQAPLDGWDGGQGGPMDGSAGEPGAGPGAGMGGRNSDDGMLPQPGRVRVTCTGEPASLSASPEATVIEFYGGDFGGGEFSWDVPYPDGWVSGQTLQVVIEAWGCGGPGSPYSNNDEAGGGGGGGAYSRITVNAIPGDFYTLRGAEQGSGGIVDTYVKDSGGSTILKAERGKYGTDNATGGVGGAAANGVGDVKYSGGSGANRVSAAVGGGGGASAGPDGDGTSASGQSGGASGTEAGRGGAGGGSDENGEDAPYPNTPADEMWPGGGGGGQGEDTNGAPTPTPGAGSGSGSRIRLTYTL